jgi:hypothetical protein
VGPAGQSCRGRLCPGLRLGRPGPAAAAATHLARGGPAARAAAPAGRPRLRVRHAAPMPCASWSELQRPQRPMPPVAAGGRLGARSAGARSSAASFGSRAAAPLGPPGTRRLQPSRPAGRQQVERALVLLRTRSAVAGGLVARGEVCRALQSRHRGACDGDGVGAALGRMLRCRGGSRSHACCPPGIAADAARTPALRLPASTGRRTRIVAARRARAPAGPPAANPSHPAPRGR